MGRQMHRDIMGRLNLTFEAVITAADNLGLVIEVITEIWAVVVDFTAVIIIISNLMIKMAIIIMINIKCKYNSNNSINNNKSGEMMVMGVNKSRHHINSNNNKEATHEMAFIMINLKYITQAIKDQSLNRD